MDFYEETISLDKLSSFCTSWCNFKLQIPHLFKINISLQMKIFVTILIHYTIINIFTRFTFFLQMIFQVQIVTYSPTMPYPETKMEIWKLCQISRFLKKKKKKKIEIYHKQYHAMDVG
jgi:hypothetical protein